MTRAIQRSSRAICSSRGGSVPMATRTLRRCSTVLPAGSSSRARWVSSLAGPGSRRIAGAALLSSQAATVPGRSAAGEGVVEGLQLRADAARPRRRAGSRSRCCTAQRAHRPAWMRPGCPQSGQLRQKPGSGRVQAEQSGSPRVPPRTGPAWPQRAHRIQRCLQARHHGSPVALGDQARGACRPQIEQVIVLTGAQAGHSGPSGSGR